MYHFPFGEPVRPVRQTPIANAKVFVLGVYASAVHARWIGPDGGQVVAALAVASEPEIFWRGEGAEEIVGRITVPLRAGRLIAAAQGSNGPSGRALDELYLAPLGVDRGEAWLCDLLPESRANPAQRERIERLYDPLVRTGVVPAATIPPAPTGASQIVDAARVSEIADEFERSGAEVLVTLGDHPLKEFVRAWPSGRELCPTGRLSSLVGGGNAYGMRRSMKIRDRKADLIALAHPRQAAGLGSYSQVWKDRHNGWIRSLR